MKIIFLGLGLVSAAAVASDVKITSFRFLDQAPRRSPAAELCGQVTPPTGKAEMIKIVSDPDSKGPGNYYTWAGANGKFCSVIATYTGQAEAVLE